MTVEQRVHPRFKVSWRAKVVVPGQGFMRGTVKDVSMGGALLEFPIAMPIESLALMEIYPVLEGEIYPVRLKAKVMYDALLSDNRGHGLGLRFVTFAEPQYKDILRKAVEGAG